MLRLFLPRGTFNGEGRFKFEGEDGVRKGRRYEGEGKELREVLISVCSRNSLPPAPGVRPGRTAPLRDNSLAVFGDAVEDLGGVVGICAAVPELEGARGVAIGGR